MRLKNICVLHGPVECHCQITVHNKREQATTKDKGGWQRSPLMKIQRLGVELLALEGYKVSQTAKKEILHFSLRLFPVMKILIQCCGSRMSLQDHISESLEAIFLVQNTLILSC